MDPDIKRALLRLCRVHLALALFGFGVLLWLVFKPCPCEKKVEAPVAVER